MTESVFVVCVDFLLKNKNDGKENQGGMVKNRLYGCTSPGKKCSVYFCCLYFSHTCRCFLSIKTKFNNSIIYNWGRSFQIFFFQETSVE